MTQHTSQHNWEELDHRVKEKQPTSAQQMWGLLQDCWKSIPGEESEPGCGQVSAVLLDRPGEWAEFVPWAEMAQNSLLHSSTNISPFQCVLGYQPVLAPWHQGQTEVPVVDDWFRHADETWEAVRVHLQQAVMRQQVDADHHCSETPGLALDPKPTPPPALL
ncbi:unnamed protein product [Oncorhynchus mykiss]|uniref:Uncharacterized protein n=1 Tax=Oncorhynchus mykiss TaxID=8022 RepID=A0A060XG03_ONCMY|nr:unnamed protein product [Oncorhynchus mykiss]